MMIAPSTAAASIAAISPLMLSDRLLTLAQDADRAGFRGTAEYLLGLASDVLEPAPARRRAQPRYRA